MNAKTYTLGLDYGTDSVRALIVNTQTGEEAGSSVVAYPRWKSGKYCAPAQNQFRQHPLDYIEGLILSVGQALAQAPAGTANHIAAIAVDTTGSTPVAVDRQGTPLALLPEFAENPEAMFILWKDHTAIAEADQINARAASWGGTDYTKYEGGIYSSEWFWAKILHTLRKAPEIRKKAFSWVEHCDWIPALLTGQTDPLTLKRSRCAAGHKAMWHPEWNGLPSESFLVGLDPLLSGLRDRLYTDTYTVDQIAGNLSAEWAAKLGLKPGIPVSVGAFDAHLGAVGGEIQPFFLSKVMGTSTCDMIIAPENEIGANLIKGICGQVHGSITPGFVGLEAGQSAFGDLYAWFKNLLAWPLLKLLPEISWLTDAQKHLLIEETANKILPQLTTEAQALEPESTSELALDWMNGRRTPDANQNLKGAITGLSLGSDAPRIFRALVEATAFGAKAIVDRFVREGIRIDGVIALGGVAKKSQFVMQVVADVLNMPIKVARSEQTCALGSAMAAAVAAGIHPDFSAAQQAMGSGIETEYRPDPSRAAWYARQYQKYLQLGQFVESA